MKNMNSKPLKFLFACCLFLAVGIGCLKSTAAHVIRDAYIGSAFSFRTNDVVALACPDLEIDRAMEIQRLVERHPQLDRVIHRYLRAYAAFLAGKNTPLEKMDNSRSFARLNRDILKAVKRSSNSSALAISDEEFLAQLTEAEDEAEWILLNRLPPALRNLGEPAIAATRVYGAVTSFWVQAVLLLGMLLPLLMPVVLYAQRSSPGIIPFFRLTPLVSPAAKEGSASDTASSYSAGIGAYYRSLGKVSLLQGCFWTIVPFACIKAADRWVLSVTDRLLGRSMYLDTAPFLWRGAILIGCGGAVWFLASRLSALRS